MLLGKRPIKRTTSMTGITVDIDPHHLLHQAILGPEGPPPAHQMTDFGHNNNVVYEEYDHHDQLSVTATMVSPENMTYQQHQHQRTGSSSSSHSSRRSNEFIETAHFLKNCGLCKRRLAPGKDIYMYRGDTAFCSSECREQQMKQDEQKEKIAAAAAAAASKSKNNAASTSSKRSEITVAAAY